MRSFAAAILLAAVGQTSAETLVLNDGSVIQGEIKTLRDGVYTIQTESLGTVRVRKEDIRAIELGDESASTSTVPPPDSGSVRQAELQAMQSRMMQIPDLFSMIQALQNDPEVQAVLTDPEIMAAMTSGDFAKLMNHPKIIALTGNPRIREIIEEVQ
jgi:hypothetical protein